jgi:O-antigen ligase/tetratricopeptide (TPR) repeat protein
MKNESKDGAISAPQIIVGTVAFWLSLSLLVLVPLAFSTSAYRTFSLPKFLILLSGSAALVPLIAFTVMGAGRQAMVKSGSKHVLLVSAYVALIAVSTAVGVAPVASLFGSFENQMGLVTRLCFYICFLAIICGIGQSWARLVQTLWAMCLTGLCVATYAFAQFFGRDLFLPSSLYTFNSMGETVVRPIGTLGHADYLGNFLLYTTPLCVGFALGSSGRTRRFGIVAAAVSTAAIAFSGTRGAWLGLIVGGVVFVALERPRKADDLPAGWLRPLALPVAIACFVGLLSVLLIASNPASRNMVVRARLLVTEGFTGAGRTLLWRDSFRMLPDFAIAGCGPEGFRRAFLAYKSDELARFAPEINNESSHNSYLDAAISFGLPGAGLYAAIIASVFSLLSRSRRRINRKRRVIITGLLSSFAAVTAHNFFIFDQVPTGLYFFGFLALAYAVANVADPEERKDAEPGDRNLGKAGREKDARQTTPVKNNKGVVLAVGLSGVVLLVSGSYSFLAINADKHLSEAFGAANHANLDEVMSHVNIATRRFDPTGDRAFVAARALTLCAEKVQALRESTRGIDDDNLARSMAIAIKAAMTHAGKSLAHTLTPDSNYLLLAYLASLSGDVPGLHSYAAEALKWDPQFANSRWLMAEAYLAEGNREEAGREAERALDINPSLRRARIILARARGESEPGRPTVEESIERARSFITAGKPARAERVLRRAIVKSGGPCPECHRLLASIYEAENLYAHAIAEWQTFITQAPDRASAEGAALRIDALRQKSGPVK